MTNDRGEVGHMNKVKKTWAEIVDDIETTGYTSVDAETFDHINDLCNDPPGPNARLRELLQGDKYRYLPKIAKARLDLIPPYAIYAMAEAFEDGALKRAEHNWEVGESARTWKISDRISAIQRHSLQLQMGCDIAEDSKIHHAAHIMANAAMLLGAYLKGYGYDDRILERETK